MPNLTCPFCVCVVLVIHIHMYRASVCAPAVKICYGYSFLNVHAVRVRETRIMGVWCTRVLCLSRHVMRHMVHLCVYKQVSHLRQVALLFSHLCMDVFEDGMLVCLCTPYMQAFTRRSRAAERRRTPSLWRLVRHSSANVITPTVLCSPVGAACFVELTYCGSYEHAPCVLHSSSTSNLDRGDPDRMNFGILMCITHTTDSAVYPTLCHSCVLSVLQIPCSVQHARIQGFFIEESPLKCCLVRSTLCKHTHVTGRDTPWHFHCLEGK